MKKHKSSTAKRISKPCKGYANKYYDSELESTCSYVLGESVRHLGGRASGDYGLTIKYTDPKGQSRWYVPDWEVIGANKVLIEAKARLDVRSRNHLTAAINQGYQVGVIFPNERAAGLPLWKGALQTMKGWLSSHGIVYVTSPDRALELLETLLNQSKADEEAI